MNTRQLVIWGSFEDYEKMLPAFRVQEDNGSVKIVAVIFLDENVVQQVDDYPVITIEDINNIYFDFIIGLENELTDDMIKILEMVGISREKFLGGRIFNLPGFNFEEYSQLRNAEISIISDNCWGGLTYHSLDYPFLSPFINMYVERGHFGRLLANFPQYMQQPLEYVETKWDKGQNKRYPVCRLHDVLIHCNHYDNYEQAKVFWNMRKERINYKNLFVKMLIETEEDLEQFRSIPYCKIGFSMIPASDAQIIDCSSMKNYIQEKYQGRFWEFANWQARSDRVDLKHYYVLKLLLGEEDYRRTK